MEKTKVKVVIRLQFHATSVSFSTYTSVLLLLQLDIMYLVQNMLQTSADVNCFFVVVADSINRMGQTIFVFHLS
jgi:hypothetical protein